MLGVGCWLLFVLSRVDGNFQKKRVERRYGLVESDKDGKGEGQGDCDCDSGCYGATAKVRAEAVWSASASDAFECSKMRPKGDGEERRVEEE